MPTIAEQLENLPSINQVVLPDLWQQEAVTALRQGKDVVVHAPTGAGKTLIFELWSHGGKPRGQAIYTVPTRALANDKLAEWRSRGWDVGIATGDLAENLHAPVLVATLETQKARLIQGDGPASSGGGRVSNVGRPDRGLNYELAIALAPRRTQLLLLSGSVANPQDVVTWLRRLGREAVLVRSDIRPVPLEEVPGNSLNFFVPSEIRGYWPRFVAKALAENLGPILIFAPRRQAAEALANELARYLPNPNPLTLRPDQKQLVGEHLTKLLKSRVAYHHSGLAYAVRAGLIEPLAKAGQLRVVVATMGLAAGINFSLRSVALAGDSYRRDYVEQPLKPDEILQMFGRAGRRGIDEVGYVLVSSNEIRLRDGYAAHLSRSGMVDWNALLGVMHAAGQQGRDPFSEAVHVQTRLFSSRPIFIGVEESLKNPETPCGLKTDSERARHVRLRVREMLNSRGRWERMPGHTYHPVGQVRWMEPITGPALELLKLQAPLPDEATSPFQPTLHPLVTNPTALEKVGTGALVVIDSSQDRPIHGRAVTVADRLHDGRCVLVKWIRRLTRWTGREVTPETWDERVAPLIAEKLGELHTPVLRFELEPHKALAIVSLADLPIRVPVDQYGVPLWRPTEREVMPDDCARCWLVPVCRQLPTATGVAMLWRRLHLVDAAGVPTQRGRIVSFFSQGDGLAIAAALEEKEYPLEELIYDLANLDAGFRFAGDENRWGGRLALSCSKAYGLLNAPGYLENGLPLKYGAGAAEVVAANHKNPQSKYAWLTETVGPGDVDRIIIEWRSLLRRIMHAPALDWPRWTELQQLAKSFLNETESPTLTELPRLDYAQTRRVDHRLILRRH